MAVRQEQLFFKTNGYGDNLLVLIHAFPVNSKLFDKIIDDMLPEDWRVILPDLPGFGKTPEDSTREMWSMEDLAHKVYNICPENSGNTVIGGVSMGGYITQAFAKQYPEFADGYILSNTRDTADADGGAGRREVVEKILNGQRDEYLRDNLLERVLGPTTLAERSDIVDLTLEMFSETTDKAIIQTMRGMAERDASRAFLKSLDKPILVICGEEDKLTGPTTSQEMVNSYKNATYVEIPSSGHYSAIENPAPYATAIKQFLEGL